MFVFECCQSILTETEMIYREEWEKINRETDVPRLRRHTHGYSCLSLLESCFNECKHFTKFLFLPSIKVQIFVKNTCSHLTGIMHDSAVLLPYQQDFKTELKWIFAKSHASTHVQQLNVSPYKTVHLDCYFTHTVYEWLALRFVSCRSCCEVLQILFTQCNNPKWP